MRFLRYLFLLSFILFSATAFAEKKDAAKVEINICSRPEVNKPFFFTVWQEDTMEYKIGIKGIPNGATKTTSKNIRATGTVTWLRVPSPTRQQTVLEVEVSSLNATINGKSVDTRGVTGASFRILYSNNFTNINKINKNQDFSQIKAEKISEAEQILLDMFAPNPTTPESVLGEKLNVSRNEGWKPNTDILFKLLKSKGINSEERNWFAQAQYRGVNKFQGVDCHNIEVSHYTKYLPCYDCKIDVSYRIPSEGNGFPLSIKKQILEIIDHVMPDTEQVFTGTSFTSVYHHRGETILLPTTK